MRNSTCTGSYAGSHRNKKFLQILSYFLALVVIFVFGFYCGVKVAYEYIPEKQVVDVYGEDVEETNVEEEPVSENVSIEQTKLDELKAELVSLFKEKYPSVDLSFAVINLDSGVYTVHNDKQMNSASVIKLFILETVYKELAKGTYELTQDKKDELRLMITESNNPASNLFIDDFGGENENRKVTGENIINKVIKEQGYAYTELNRKMYDTTPPHGESKFDNYTSAMDVCRFLEGIYDKTLLAEPYNTETLEMLKAQTRKKKIPAKIKQKYPDITVANKTGELSKVENDAALIMCDEFNLAFTVLTGDIPPDSDGDTDYVLKTEIQETISDMGLKLVEFYKNQQF